MLPSWTVAATGGTGDGHRADPRHASWGFRAGRGRPTVPHLGEGHYDRPGRRPARRVYGSAEGGPPCPPSRPSADRSTAADLGRTYMHEHIFVLTPDVQQNYPGRVGRRGRAGGRRGGQAGGVGRPGGAHHRRPDGDRTRVATSPGSNGWPTRCPTSTSWWPPGATRTATSPSSSTTARPAIASAPRHGGARADGAACSPATSPTGSPGPGCGPGCSSAPSTSDGLTAGVERVMRAVAKTHLATGCPITVHTHPESRQGLDVQRVMAEEGVDPGRVVLGHSGDSTDVDHLTPWPRPASGWGWTASASTSRPRSRPGPTRWWSCAGGASPTVWSCPTTPPATSTGSTPGALSFMPQWHYLHIEQDVLPVPA